MTPVSLTLMLPIFPCVQRSKAPPPWFDAGQVSWVV
jgi:hypothetical protein